MGVRAETKAVRESEALAESATSMTDSARSALAAIRAEVVQSSFEALAEAMTLLKSVSLAFAS